MRMLKKKIAIFKLENFIIILCHFTLTLSFEIYRYIYSKNWNKSVRNWSEKNLIFSKTLFSFFFFLFIFLFWGDITLGVSNYSWSFSTFSYRNELDRRSLKISILFKFLRKNILRFFLLFRKISFSVTW